MRVTSEAQAHANHIREHGGQIFQRTELEHRWIWNPDGQGTLKTELESRIGTDENRLFIKGHIHKAESEQADYDIAALYSRAISDFWDVQAGVRYQYVQADTDSYLTARNPVTLMAADSTDADKFLSLINI